MSPILLPEVLFLLLIELLLRRWVAHVFTEELLSVVLGNGFRYFVDLWLECVLAVDLLLLHLTDNFLTLLVFSVKSIIFLLWMLIAASRVTLTDDLTC